MTAHAVKEPVVAVPECLAVLLHAGEEAPDLRVLLEDVVGSKIRSDPYAPAHTLTPAESFHKTFPPAWSRTQVEGD